MPRSIPAGVAGSILATAALLLDPEVAVTMSPEPGPEPDGPIVDAPAAVRQGPSPHGTVVLVTGRIRTRLLDRAGGWADRRRCVAIVSTDGLNLDRAHDRDRVAKLVAHKASHLLGLRHCRTRGCIARPVADLVALEGLDGFCPSCRRRLGRAPTRRR
ncbi:MAG: hypothetical protein HY658_06570 [Actinobacteria bacterium]|nr:hypothetical protein [Actinomycetota bacterium]